MGIYTQLTQEERYQIHALMKAGHEQAEVARILGRSPSTISRELRRNKRVKGYRPKQAHRLASNRRAAKVKPRLFPSLVDDVLKDPSHCVDNVFASVWKALNFSRLIQRAGFKKRSGVPVVDSVFLLVLWKWIAASSIAVFAKQSLKVFSEAKKDVMYELLTSRRALWLARSKRSYCQ